MLARWGRLRPAPLQGTVDQREELFGLERLREETRGAAVAGYLGQAELVVTGQHQRREPRTLAHRLAHEREAAPAWHVDIAEQEREASLGETATRLLRISRERADIALALEQAADGRPYAGVVVDDEDVRHGLFGHRLVEEARRSWTLTSSIGRRPATSHTPNRGLLLGRPDLPAGALHLSPWPGRPSSISRWRSAMATACGRSPASSFSAELRR